MIVHERRSDDGIAGDAPLADIRRPTDLLQRWLLPVFQPQRRDDDPDRLNGAGRSILSGIWFGALLYRVVGEAVTSGSEIRAVRIERIDGYWTVFIHEHGKVAQQAFESEKFATSFADGHRFRMGILRRKDNRLTGLEPAASR